MFSFWAVTNGFSPFFPFNLIHHHGKKKLNTCYSLYLPSLPLVEYAVADIIKHAETNTHTHNAAETERVNTLVQTFFFK